jgi:hypothetical protein
MPKCYVGNVVTHPGRNQETNSKQFTIGRDVCDIDIEYAKYNSRQEQKKDNKLCILVK